MSDNESVISTTDDESQVISTPEEDESVLPDGWDGAGDFFDENSWGGASTDETATGPSAEDASTESPAVEEPSTTGDESRNEGEQAEAEVPDGEQEPTTTSRKLKFTAQVDHSDRDVELDEADLPSLYQKAQVVDRVQAKLNQQNTTLDRASKLAKGMGYKTTDEMIVAAAKSYRDAEIDRLVNDPDHPVHPDVAADIIDRRLNYTDLLAEEPDTASETTAPAQTAAAAAPVASAKRDWGAEVAELLSARPDLRVKELPDEVTSAAINGHKRLLVAYTDYEKNQNKAVVTNLQKENHILKQNASSAARAPVKGVTGGGVTDTQPKDDFLDGFNSDDKW